MSKADKLFKELGYKKDNENAIYTEYYNKGEDTSFVFDKKYKTLEAPKTPYYCIDMKTLKAINEKVKELGWNE